jgi:septal ring factor EnvC (AmiA/AmiB activator)
MIQQSPKPKPARAQLEQLRQALAAPAWRLWTSLARSDPMADTGDRERFQARHQLVLALIEINSQQLRCDSQAAGLDIERLNAERDVEHTDNAEQARSALAEVERRAAEVDAKRRKLAQERDWLESSLAEFDAQLQSTPDKPTSANN